MFRTFLILVLAVLALGLARPGPAEAAFTGSGRSTAVFAAGTLAAPGGLQASASCAAVPAVGPNSVTLTWTPTASAFATGYTIEVTAGTSTTTVTVAGRASSSYTYPIEAATGYRFALRSTFRAWTSARTAQTAQVGCGLL